jgi:hypothetical protein
LQSDQKRGVYVRFPHTVSCIQRPTCEIASAPLANALCLFFSLQPHRICPKCPLLISPWRYAHLFILKNAYSFGVCKLLLTSAANSLPVRHASGYWLDMHLSFLRLRAFWLVQLQTHYSLQHASESRISLTELTKFGSNGRLQTCGLLLRWEMRHSSPRTVEVVLRPGIISQVLALIGSNTYVRALLGHQSEHAL